MSHFPPFKKVRSGEPLRMSVVSRKCSNRAKNLSSGAKKMPAYLSGQIWAVTNRCRSSIIVGLVFVLLRLVLIVVIANIYVVDIENHTVTHKQIFYVVV